MNQNIRFINQDALRTAHTIMQDKFHKIIHYYFEDTESYIRTIEQGMIEKNASAVVPAAHTIKSSSKQIGVDYVSQIALDIEMLGKDVLQGHDTWQQISDKTDEIKRIYILSRQKLEESLKDIL